MKRIGLWIGIGLAVALATTAFGFDAYFSDDAGNKVLSIWEGRYVYVAVKDPEKGACGIDQFQADLLIFDFKTGAYIDVRGAWFRELGGIGSGLYFWVDAQNSPNKVQVPVGSRLNYAAPPAGHVHVLQPAGFALWQDGAWEYVDANMPPLGNALPATMSVSRINLANFYPEIQGRLENMDTLILIVGDLTDERNIDQDQLKIKDTVAKLTVTPAKVVYGCPGCENIVVRIEDLDENLNCGEIERVPFFVILNPGSWNQDPLTGKDFCSLIRYGGVDAQGQGYFDPIRWFNIYNPDRFIDYADAPWWDPAWPGVIRAVFFAIETAPDSGVFTFNFGNLEDLQQALGLPRDAKLPMGTTIAFYYIDPNDFDDMDLATIVVGDRPHAQVMITNEGGLRFTEPVRIGWGGIYIRVYDADANVNACCQDRVVVHLCDPHNEDDSEYIIIDEISNNSGVFVTQSAIPLLPVWDAVSGYQLVFDDWKLEVFNEDTVFVRYNSVDYVEEDLGFLGDGNPNDGRFPPRINYAAARNQYWDVAFDKIKIYDYQVFDGTTHRMRFLDGEYKPLGPTVPLAGQLYLEVTDLDQNENPLLRELIFGGWNRDQDPVADEHSAPVWGVVGPVVPPPPEMPPAPPAALLPQQEQPPAPPEQPGPPVIHLPAAEGFFHRQVPGNMLGLRDRSITNFPATVKIFIANLQRGTWERIDLRETGVSTGIFRSTTCVLVTDDRHPGDGNLGSRPGDTLIAFYQDPSNHSDVSIISIKVTEGGAGEVVPPVVKLEVAFDRAQYFPGDTVTITVTDEQYAGAAEIVGTNVLVLLDKDGGVIASWNRLEAVAGQPGVFRVTYVLPETVKLGTITARYTDPMTPTRTRTATATVVAKKLTGVAGVAVAPNPFKTTTTFTVQTEPTGAVAEKVTITIYDLTGAKVAVLEGRNTASVTWNGGNLGNGAYIFVAVVEDSGKVFGPFKGFVYIER